MKPVIVYSLRVPTDFQGIQLACCCTHTAIHQYLGHFTTQTYLFGFEAAAWYRHFDEHHPRFQVQGHILIIGGDAALIGAQIRFQAAIIPELYPNTKDKSVCYFASSSINF